MNIKSIRARIKVLAKRYSVSALARATDVSSATLYAFLRGSSCGEEVLRCLESVSEESVKDSVRSRGQRMSQKKLLRSAGRIKKMILASDTRHDKMQARRRDRIALIEERLMSLKKTNKVS